MTKPTPEELAELAELRRLEDARRQARERMQRVRAAARARGSAPPAAPVEKLALSIPEAARQLGIGTNSAYKAAAAGQIPTVRIGDRILVPRAALAAMLAKAGA
jgi:excisionase family DNA binding protein